MDGIVVVDKPSGISSFKVVQEVRRICRIKKAGHTGTLDPMATGILTVCLGRATKLVQFMMHGRKCYEGTMVLGASTDTCDSEGKTVEERGVPASLSIEDIRKESALFRGKIRQRPPAFSALKHNGVPLYKLARKGTIINKPPREIEIFKFEIREFDPPEISFFVECSQGTYIRSLVHDLGDALGCGAYMTSLRRTANGSFNIGHAVSLPELEGAAENNMLDKIIIRPEDGLKHIMSITVSPQDADHLRHGRPVEAGKIMDRIKNTREYENCSLPYIRVETTGKDSSDFVAIARRPSSVTERIKTLKVWN